MGDADERPQVFKFNQTTWLSAIQTDIKADLAAATPAIIESTGGLQNGRVWYNINSGAVAYTEPTNKQNQVEFLGFSRIDGFPMFRAYRQFNTAHTAVGTLSTRHNQWLIRSFQFLV
jgi:hypothetical protein